jgi:hypothetical protein
MVKSLGEKMKSKKIIVILSDRDYQKLKALSDKERLSISSLVRHFIIRKIYDGLPIATNN